MTPPRQIGWVISVEDWALIRRLVAAGVPQRQVARDLRVGRSTVARAVASDGPPKYERAAVLTSFAPFEPAVRQLLGKTPDLPATVIAERVGWTGSITWFRNNVRRLRPEHRPVDPSDRLTWVPGDGPQRDLWFPPKKTPLEDGSKTLLPVMVITAAHSRFMVERMIPTWHTQDLLLGMWMMLLLGRVPRRLIWDNETGMGRGKRHAEGVGAITGTQATTLQRLKAYSLLGRTARRTLADAGITVRDWIAYGGWLTEATHEAGERQ